MAQPGVAEGNGATEPQNLEQPAPAPYQPQHADQSVAAGAKRKRDDDPGDKAADEVGETEKDSASANGIPKSATRPNEKALIRAIYRLLKQSDPTCSVFDKPIQSEERAEPPSKRSKSEDPSPTPSTIAAKVAHDEYTSLDGLADDVSAVVKARLAETSPSPGPEEVKALNSIRKKTIELIKRELSYPHTPHPISPRAGQATTTLTLMPNVQNARQLYSSLPTGAAAARVSAATEARLPKGLSTTTLNPRSEELEVGTLGDVLPASKNRTPLLPSAATAKAALPKPGSKENAIGFYHPELSDTSMRRPNGYSGARLAVGHYLDYTKATPHSPVKTKQRERAQSLAGHKPSSSELEVSEMESLFRTAFSSFAPCKDDSGAIVPSTVAGRMLWQKKGRHDFQSQIQAEYGAEPVSDEMQKAGAQKSEADNKEPEEIDEDIIEKIITDFDPSTICPSLRGPPRLGQEDEASEEDVEALLQEVDDLILTLASSQHIRNGTKSVTSTNRLAVGEPDMLTNSQLPEPSETELETYETLKSLLVSILQRLPPYAVAKLNGDQLNELLISTRVPIQQDDYKGVMNEDDAAVNLRARQKLQQQQQQQQQRMQGGTPGTAARGHRASNPPVYVNHHQTSNAHFAPPAQSRTPVPHPSYYRTVSGPTGTPNSVPRPGQAHVSPIQHHSQPQRPPSQPYRTSGYTAPFAPQLAKTQTPYGHQGMAQYTPGARPQPSPAGYANTPQHASPNARYANPYQAGYPSQQQPPPAHANFGGYVNGASSPQVGHAALPYGQAQYQQQQQQPQQQQQLQTPARYGTPVAAPSTPVPRTPHMPNNSHMAGSVSTAPGLTGYRTVMPESEQQRMMEQARVRAAAQERASGYNQPAAISGLAGIGLGVGQSANRPPQAAQASGFRPSGPAAPVQGGGAPLQRGGMPNGAQGSPGLSHAPAKVSPVPVPVIPPQRPQSSEPNQVQYSTAQMPQPPMHHPHNPAGVVGQQAPQMPGQQGARTPQQPLQAVPHQQRPPLGTGE